MFQAVIHNSVDIRVLCTTIKDNVSLAVWLIDWIELNAPWKREHVLQSTDIYGIQSEALGFNLMREQLLVCFIYPYSPFNMQFKPKSGKKRNSQAHK